MKTKIILLLLTIVITGLSFSQECGTPTNTPNIDYGQQRRASQSTNEGPYCISIKFHIVRNSDGTGGFNPSNLDNIISNINEDFNPHNIYFTNIGFDYINDDIYYNLDQNEFDNLVQINNNPQAINVYIVASSNWTGGAARLLHNYLFTVNVPDIDGIISHELGHCLNLHHTHNGTYICERDPDECAEIDGDTYSDIVEIMLKIHRQIPV